MHLERKAYTDGKGEAALSNVAKVVERTSLAALANDLDQVVNRLVNKADDMLSGINNAVTTEVTEEFELYGCIQYQI
jgi:hypothetical protein